MSYVLFLDEAGTSTQEPITIVAGVLADQQGRARVDQYLAELRESIPAEVRHGFVFHAKEIISGGPRVSRDQWNRQGVDRRALMSSLLAAPRLCGLQIAFGYDKKRPAAYFRSKEHVFRHGIAFLFCLHAADKLLHSRHPGESASVIAEDHREMRSKLAGMIKDLSSPVIRQALHRDRQINLIEPIKFARKESDPALQVADAMAYGLRAILSGSPNAAQYQTAIFGQHASLPDVKSDPSGFFAWDFHPSR